LSHIFQRTSLLLGEKFTIADITAHFMFNLSKILKIDLEDNYKNVFRWKSELEDRPSNPINNLI